MILALLIVLAVMVIALAIGIPLIAWFYLAPNNYFFTFVDEGTVKIVVKAGRFEKALIQYKGYALDENSNVVPENTWVKDGKIVRSQTPGAKKYKESWHPFGGLRWVGIWPFRDIYVYSFAWEGVSYKGEIDTHPKETVNWIYVKRDIYLCLIKEAETKSPQNLPLDVGLLLTIGIINPYKALFRIDNWLETVVNKIRAIVIDYVRKYTWEDLLLKKERMGKEIQRIAKEEKILEEFIGYGVDLRKIELQSIDPTAVPATELRKATLKKFLAEQKKKEVLVEAEAESAKRAQETMGVIIQMISQATGLGTEEIQKRIREDEELFERILKLSEGLVIRQESIRGNSLFDIRVDGAEGMQKDFLNLLAAFKVIPKGGTQKSPKEKPEKKT